MCLDMPTVLAWAADVAAQIGPPLGRAELPPAWSAGWAPGPELYGVGAEFDVPIRMSDGVTLRASVAFPTDLATGERADGSFPVLLEQSPYHQGPVQDGVGAAGFTLSYRYFVTRGYICVSAQVRGTHHAEGEFGLISEREKQDGVELVDWAARQLARADGHVGLTGCSYTGMNQYFTAALVGKDSPVKAIVPTGVGIDWYREPGFMGGVPTITLEKAFFEVWANGGTESAVQYTHEILADLKSGGDIAYDREFWRTRSAASVIEKIVQNNIPALICAGWRDYPTSPGEAYVMFQNAYAKRDIWAAMAPDQATTPRYQLIMGSEPHCSGRDHGPMAEAALKWFDTWVKGIDTGLQRARSTLHLNDVDSDRWLSGTVYPPVARYRTYHLDADGRLDDASPDAVEACDRLCYAAPAYPGATLTYESEPFPDGALLAGPIAATLHATSTKTEILIIADVFDVAPDGAARQLSTGALAGSHRTLDEAKSWRDGDGRLVRPYHGSADETPVTPGEVMQLDIQLQPRVARLAAGHTLRLVLKTQSDPAPCVTLFPAGEAFWCASPTVTQRRALLGATFEVRRSNVHRSVLNVPLMNVQAV